MSKDGNSNEQKLEAFNALRCFAKERAAQRGLNNGQFDFSVPEQVYLYFQHEAMTNEEFKKQLAYFLNSYEAQHRSNMTALRKLCGLEI